MKKLLVVLCATFVASLAFGQGNVVFNNNNARRINLANGTAAPLGTPVGLYVVSGGARTLVLSTNINLAPGIFNSGNRQIAVPAGSTPDFQVSAWVGGLDYESALQKGDSVVFTSAGPLTSGTTPGPATANGAWGVVTIVPEPSTIALGLLGLGAIALFRRKK